MVTKTTMAVNPFASWVCTIGMATTFGIAINSADGLPVELMEFSVETEETSEPDTGKPTAGEIPEEKASG